jgi:catechol 2,3-dioxygenase-like lactoylglutathione lyase family enzyme
VPDTALDTTTRKAWCGAERSRLSTTEGELEMIDHVKVAVRDLETAKRFYSAALAPLGYAIHFEAEGMAYYADATTLDFGVGTDGDPGGAHVGFTAVDADQVRAFYEAALGAGGKDNGEPGLRPEYGSGYFAAYVLDPDGNNIEAKCHLTS